MGSSLKSFNLDNHFVRHANFLGELSAVASDLDRTDATFDMVNGLADRSLVSFRSVNFPLHFLRHQDFRVKLHEGPNTPLVPPGSTPPPDSPEMQLMRKDATFAMVPGLADPNAVSFRSFNFPDRFLRHRDFHLFVEEVHSDLDRKDATFTVVPGLSPEPPGPH
ncbi:AbfB domain-containing protein [Streptomyces davaonensis]|nr:AbfB domain-containing protein [Streptomyces davaonensis]